MAQTNLTAADITDLVLITGQSNVTGSQTQYIAGTDTGDMRVFAYTSGNDWEVADLHQAWDVDGWHPGNGSVNPGCEADPNCIPREPYNNFAFHFAKTVVENDPDRVVGIILAGAPGQGILHWDEANPFWPTIKNKVLAALNAQGTKAELDGILWHQGETDWQFNGTSDPDATDTERSHDTYYPEKLNGLIQRFRSKSWFSDGKPFICGETKQAPVNGRLMALNTDANPWTACVAAADLPTREMGLDANPPKLGTHFTGAALRTLGKRYGEKYLAMVNDSENNIEIQRQQAVSQIISALEDYAADNGTFIVVGYGARGLGRGWFHYARGVYPALIYSGLNKYLSTTPSDPLHGDLAKQSSNDFLVYQCKDRVAVFAKSDNLQTTTSDKNWWTRNNCTSYPFNIQDHQYFQVSQPLGEVFDNATVDPQRQLAVSQVVTALEAYAAEHGTYTVTGYGARGNGQGWFHYARGLYPDSIASGLSAYLTTTPTDPLHVDLTKHNASDFLVYRCKDRIAVFAKSASLQTTTFDQNWWTQNNCTTNPINKYDHRYFQLSQTVDEVFDNTIFDLQRQTAVSQVINALEAFAADKGTYTVTGHGANGRGQGWFHHTGGIYPASIYSGLGSYLSTTPSDPLHVDLTQHSSNDFLVYRCKDRIAVFAKSGSLQTTTSDKNWWTQNNCTTSPINRFDHQFFKLSQPLD